MARFGRFRSVCRACLRMPSDHLAGGGRRKAAVAVAALVVVFLGYVRLKASTMLWAREQHTQLLLDVTAVMEGCNVDYYIDEGSLLGVYRDQSIILGDTDVDATITSWESRQKLLDCVEERHPFAARQMVFNDHRNTNGGMKVLDRYGFYCDLDTNIERDGKLYAKTLPHCQPEELKTLDHSKFCLIDKAVVLPLGSVVFHGRTLPIPGNTEAFLKFKYGDGWHTPISFYKGTDTNAWDTFKSHIGSIVKFVFVAEYTYWWLTADYPMTLFLLGTIAKLGLAVVFGCLVCFLLQRGKSTAVAKEDVDQ